MESLNVVALISGGKDSLFSILHCQANGHKIVALANLHPNVDDDDTESYMYQTVGHRIVPLYEEALGLPLYRRAISGLAVNQNKCYGSTSADEVEDMHTLLQNVKSHHPEVNAVCTGAILSDYQRTRVESVAIRLGLVPLSYLWQFPHLPPYNETSLLSDMAKVSQDARLIKVASGGLDESSLWANVADTRFVNQTVSKFRRLGITDIGSALGEGGEYETLALDGPRSLWKGSIVVLDGDRKVVPGESGSASLSIVKARVEIKSESKLGAMQSPRIPPVFDDHFVTVRETVRPHFQPAIDTVSRFNRTTAQSIPAWQIQATSGGMAIHNATDNAGDAVTQMHNIMERLINEHRIYPSAIILSTIILRTMSDFPVINASYGSFFKAPNPPARVTIACGDCLPDQVLVSLSIVVSNKISQASKKGLHVQSRSYWAPANIGPYSQAISVPVSLSDSEGEFLGTISYLAGQIPLHPASMAIYNNGSQSIADYATDQINLSLQHLWRIGQAIEISSWLGSVAFVSANAFNLTSSWAPMVAAAWRSAHHYPQAQSLENVDDVDVWDLKNGVRSDSSSVSTYKNHLQTDFLPPCFTAEIDALPRAVDVEWQSTGFHSDCGGLCQTVHGDASFKHTRLDVKTMGNTVPIAGWVSIQDASFEINQLKLPGTAVFTFYSTLAYQADRLQDMSSQVVPCRRIWDISGRLVLAVLAYRLI